MAVACVRETAMRASMRCARAGWQSWRLPANQHGCCPDGQCLMPSAESSDTVSADRPKNAHTAQRNQRVSQVQMGAGPPVRWPARRSRSEIQPPITTAAAPWPGSSARQAR